MKRAALPLSIASLLAVLLACNLPFGIRSGQEPTGAESAGGPASVRLNEVLFLPGEGSSPLVELINTGAEAAALDGVSLVNERGDIFLLPDELAPTASGELIGIVFDGGPPAARRPLQGPSGFVGEESGALELLDAKGRVLDRVAWGRAQADGVRLTRGGFVGDLSPGMTIGRLPGSAAVGPLEWVAYGPAQASPGAPNVRPGVEVLLPLSGAIFDAAPATLSWYSVPGAAGYRVQISADPNFSEVSMEVEVAAPPYEANGLAEGAYFWRVQALSTDGASVPFSAARRFTLRRAASSARQAALAAGVGLNVPLIQQRKDTAMLLLESPKKTNDPHAWDAPHAEYHSEDAADVSNCGPAVVAMINAYFGGDLSQDRIGFEIYRDRKPGPERDLSYHDGFFPEDLDRALIFALHSDSGPSWRPAPSSADAFWADVTAEIDAGRPLVATVPGHVVVVTGYAGSEGERLVLVNDPLGIPYFVNLDDMRYAPIGGWGSYALMPAGAAGTRQEASLGQDADRDEVLDFDEIERFHTDPEDEDTDGDGVHDKQDIAASMFHKKYGYAYRWTAGHVEGRDYDGDGDPSELDEDNDNGGCRDGYEDLNADGIFDSGAETDNFDENDDACIRGTVRIEQEIEEGNKRERATLALSVAAVSGRPEGEPDGEATGSFSIEGTVAQGECSFAFGLEHEIDLELEISGEAPGPYRIESAAAQTVDETQRHYLCDQAIDMVFQWEVSLLLEDIAFDDEGNYDKVEEGFEVHLQAGAGE